MFATPPTDARKTPTIYIVTTYWHQHAGCTSCARGSGSAATYSWWQAQAWRAAQIADGHWATVVHTRERY